MVGVMKARYVSGTEGSAFCLVWVVQFFFPYNHRIIVGSSYTTYRYASSAPSVLTVLIHKQPFSIKFSASS